MKIYRAIPLVSILSLGACSSMNKKTTDLQTNITPKSISEKQLTGNQISWLGRVVNLDSNNGTTCATIAYIDKRHTLKQALLASNQQPFFACNKNNDFEFGKNNLVLVSGTVLDYGIDKIDIPNYPIILADSFLNGKSVIHSNKYYPKKGPPSFRPVRVSTGVNNAGSYVRSLRNN